jgi:hypothetical protein
VPVAVAAVAPAAFPSGVAAIGIGAAPRAQQPGAVGAIPVQMNFEVSTIGRA